MKNRDLSDGRWVEAAVWPTIVTKEVRLSKEDFLRQQVWEAFRPDRQHPVPKPSAPAKKRKLPLPDEHAAPGKAGANLQDASSNGANGTTTAPERTHGTHVCIDSALREWGARLPDGAPYPDCRRVNCKFPHGVGKARPAADVVREAVRARAAKRTDGAAWGRSLLSVFEEAVTRAGKTA